MTGFAICSLLLFTTLFAVQWRIPFLQKAKLRAVVVEADEIYRRAQQAVDLASNFIAQPPNTVVDSQGAAMERICLPPSLVRDFGEGMEGPVGHLRS